MAFSMILALIVSCIASLASAQNSSTGYAIHNLTRFDALKVENLAVRSNGLILTTIAAPSAQLLQIDPLGIVPPTTVLNFPEAAGAFGITEGKSDKFYIATGNFSIKTFEGVPNSFSVFEVDMCKFETTLNGTRLREPAFRKLAELPNAKLVNGMATVNDDVVLVADSIAGLVWRVDTTNGSVSIAAEDPTLKGPTAQVAGVNGIKVFNGSLYWTNTGLQGLYRIPISSDGIAQGSAELAAGHVFGDDFLMTSNGAYVASPANAILRVADGKQEVIAGVLNSTSSGIVGPTALRFGRLATDKSSLYISTNGGVKTLVRGTPGVSRIDLGVEISEIST